MSDWNEEEVRLPRYVEAYPRLFSQSVVGNWRRGWRACIWRDQTGAIAGRALIHSLSTMLYGAEYNIYPSTYYPSASDIVNMKISYSGQISSRQRAFALCPDCTARVGQLIFKGGGCACAKCHWLVKRSTLIGSTARRGERLIELEGLIGYGRPRHMQARRYELLRAEMVMLRGKIGPDPLVAHAGYASIITAEWQQAPDLPYTGMDRPEVTITGARVQR